MVIKNVPKKTPTDQAQVQISGVKDGEIYNFGILSQKLQKASLVDVGDEYTAYLDPVVPPAAPATTGNPGGATVVTPAAQ